MWYLESINNNWYWQSRADKTQPKKRRKRQMKATQSIVKHKLIMFSITFMSMQFTFRKVDNFTNKFQWVHSIYYSRYNTDQTVMIWVESCRFKWSHLCSSTYYIRVKPYSMCALMTDCVCQCITTFQFQLRMPIKTSVNCLLYYCYI